MKPSHSRIMLDPEEILERVRRGEDRLLPDERAPALDDELLLRYIRHQVSSEESMSISRLLASFACWRKRYLELLIQSSQSKSIY